MNSQTSTDYHSKPAPSRVINSTPRPANPPPGMKWIKRVTLIRNENGTVTRRTEIIRDIDKVTELEKKINTQSARIPNMKAQLSAEAEQKKTMNRRERRRLQERLRRLKKTKEKQESLREKLVQGDEQEATPATVAAPQMTCSACHLPGHMRTNRTCPVYSEQKQQTQREKPVTSVEGMKIRISSKAIEDVDDESEKVTISIPRTALESTERGENAEFGRPRKVRRGWRTPTQLQTALNNILQKVVAEVKKDPNMAVFSIPVTDKVAPGYSAIIKRPMHLQEIWQKCHRGEYESASKMMEDVDLIVKNCYQYNEGRNDSLLPWVDYMKSLVKDNLDKCQEELEEMERTRKEFEEAK